MRFNKILSGVALLVGISTLSGCSNEPYEITREEQYARDFINTFGLIAPGHDWTAAQHSDVTVNTASPTTVKIYADFNGETYLFGKYDVEAGSTPLKFDIPKGATNYRLKANGRKLAFTPGQTVDLTNGSRELLNTGENTFAGVTVTVEENPHGRVLTLTADVMKQAINFLPEDPDGVTAWNQSNIGKVTDNFRSTAKEFYIFPEYWNTSGHSKNIIGIYFEVEPETEGAEHFVMYAPENYSWTSDPIIEGDYWIMRVPFFTNPSDFFTAYDNNGNVLSGGGNSAEVSNAAYYESKGIHVIFDREITFGFYIQQGNWIMYSESKLNEYVQKEDEDGNMEWRRPSYVATFKNGTDTENNDKRYLCFEDWCYDNWDLNDMIFRVYGFDNIADGSMEKGKVYDINRPDEGGNEGEGGGNEGGGDNTGDGDDDNTTDKAFQWVVACEDLGGTDDYDFNDVVFGVEHVSGEREVKITALAAGGTLETKLFYNEHEITGGPKKDTAVESTEFYQYTEGSDDTFTEWHQWFGNYLHTSMINTSSFSGIGATVVLVLTESEGKSFTMTNSAHSTENFGGFSVQVTNTEGTKELSAPVVDETGAISEKSFPQMFVTTNNYKWPTERTPIYESHMGDTNQEAKTTVTFGGKEYKVYPNSFHDWVQNNSEGFHAQAPTGNVITWRKAD